MQGHWPLVLFLWLLLHCPKKCSCPMALRLLYIIILSKNNTTDHVLKCKLYFDSRWHLSLQEKSQNLNMMRILKEPERHSILSPYSHVIYQEKGNYLYFKMVPNKVSSIQNEWTSDKYYVPKTSWIEGRRCSMTTLTLHVTWHPCCSTHAHYFLAAYQLLCYLIICQISRQSDLPLWSNMHSGCSTPVIDSPVTL